MYLPVCVSHSVVSDSFETPWTVAHQAPLSVGFSRQEYWSGLSFPTPGIFLTQESNPHLLHWQASSLSLGKTYFKFERKKESEVAQLCPTLLRPHGLQPTSLLHPWSFLGKNTGVGCHFLLQGIFPTQGLNRGLPHCRQTLYHLSHQGSLKAFAKLL